MNLMVCYDKQANDENVYVCTYCNIKTLSCKSGANIK